MTNNNDILTELKSINKRLDGLEQGQKQQGRKLNRVQKDIKLILQYHDENVIHSRGRIERLEEKAGIPQN